MSEDRDGTDDAYEDDLEAPDNLDTEAPEDATEDEGLDEDLEDGDEPLEAEPPPAAARKGGASETIRELRARAQAAEAREAEATRRADDAARSRNAEAFQQQEQERLERMTPDERVDYRVNQAVAPLRFQTWDTNDRVAFDGLANRNSAVAAIKDEVEQVFQERVRTGNAVDRSTIATFLIGQKALNKAPRAKAAGARASAAGRDRNSVRPPASRGDSAPAGRRAVNEAEARRKRLEGQEI